MSDLGDMIAYHTGKTIMKIVIGLAVFFTTIGYLMGKFL